MVAAGLLRRRDVSDRAFVEVFVGSIKTRADVGPEAADVWYRAGQQRHEHYRRTVLSLSGRKVQREHVPHPRVI